MLSQRTDVTTAATAFTPGRLQQTRHLRLAAIHCGNRFFQLTLVGDELLRLRRNSIRALFGGTRPP